MNTLKITTAAIFIITMSACTTDFQSSNWGDSIEEVKLSENEQEWHQSDSPDGSMSAIYYEGQVENLPAIIFFAFANNKLEWGKHVFIEIHPTPDQYYTDYTIINSALQTKLGSADVDYIFSSDTKKQTSEQWGESIFRGELLIQCNWENKRTKVLHAILGENREIVHSVEYTSILSNQ